MAPTVENVGTGVVGALLALGLVLGIVRTVRRGQSARRGSRRAAEDEVRSLPVLGGDTGPAPGGSASEGPSQGGPEHPW